MPIHTNTSVHCTGLYRELDERCSFRQNLTMRSVILEIKERIDIGR